MKIILTFLILSLTIIGNAQKYFPIPNENTEWFVEVEDISGESETRGFSKFRYLVNGDTIINDTSFVEVLVDDGTEVRSYYYLYQDTVKEKVYYTQLHWDHYNLLYDFSLSEGQSFYTPEWDNLTVESVDSINISGVYRKRIIFDNIIYSDSNQENLCFIEGIGSNAGLFPFSYLSVITSVLTCFQEAGIVTYPINVHENGCDLNKTISTNINSTITGNTSIYPNPFIENIIIETTLGSEEASTLKIINLLGIIEFTTTLKLSEVNKFDLSFLKNGLYILKLDRDDESMLMKIIVKN